MCGVEEFVKGQRDRGTEGRRRRDEGGWNKAKQ